MLFNDDKKENKTLYPGDEGYKGGIITTSVIDETGQKHRVITTKDANGNIISASLVVSNTNTRDTIISTSENKEKVYVLVNELPGDNTSGRFAHMGMTTAAQDYFNNDTQDLVAADKAFKISVMSDADKELEKYTDKQNIEFQIYRGSYQYMIDYDLGDLISVEISEIGLSLDARIIACYEVVKEGVWELTLEIGTPLIKSFESV